RPLPALISSASSLLCIVFSVSLCLCGSTLFCAPTRRSAVFARFFIDRPVFAWVISIVIVLLGLLALVSLPIAQYPDITPPTIQVTCAYPGANAQVVADTVAAPIEQQVN